ncbi:MAG: 5'/3'-nucleotidase SurE, partial [Bacteroidota bacterium]|nr:5'/3'-nucleotidase SurE [Bacteroidota bacterium]
MAVSDSQGKRPRIVVTNDDGITAKGIQGLAEAMTEFGDVYVVAPDNPQSGMGHAVTFSRILRLHPFEFGRGITEARACSGTPVDCVKLAVAEVFGEDNLPDLLVSGINHGSNASINVIYSGTMSAAVEGAMCGIPSIGFSL